MARSDYSGVPDTAPSPEAANDSLNIQASPGAFGAALGEGAEHLGASLLKTAQFYGQVAADNATNNFLEQSNKILYGDPAKSTPGPNGQAVPDTGYFGLRGADAMHARPEVQQRLDELIAEQREGLQTPRARQQYDIDTRRYRAQTQAKISEYADAQQKTWATDTNNTAAMIGLNQVAAVAGDDAASAQAGEMVRNAYAKNAQLAGQDRQGALLKADQDVALARIRKLVVSDPASAQRVFDANAGVLASLPNYDGIARSVKGAVIDSQIGPATDQFISTAVAQARGSAASGGTMPAPADEARLDTADIGHAAPSVKAFQSNGWSAPQAAGIVANLYAESGINPNPHGSNDSGAAYGLAQWHSDRQADFARWAGHPIQGSSLQEQEQFVNYELTQGKYKAVGEQLKHATSAEQAAEIVMRGFENPRDQSPGAIANRAAVARQIAGGQFAPPPGQAQQAQQAQYSSAADALRATMPDTIARAQVFAEKQWPNYPDVQERFVSGVERRLNLTISQQDQQYLVDTHTVQAAIAQHNPVSEDALRSISPQVASAWDAMATENPGAYENIQRRFEANSHGRADHFGSGFSDYLSRALAPTSDPSRITNSAQLNGFVGAGKDALLTNTGVDAISDLIAARGTPQGEAFASQARTILGQMHGDITFSSASAAQFDPKGEARFSEFAAVALPILMSAYKSGNINAVLDPKSPDYLGNVARHFMRTPAQIMKDRMADDPMAKLMLEQGDEGAEARYLLKAAVTNGRLSRVEAQRIGEELGYFSRGPAPGPAPAGPPPRLQAPAPQPAPAPARTYPLPPGYTAPR